VANHSYFPILIGPEYPLSRDALYEKLKENGIYARRYFYPLISDFPMYKSLPSSTAETVKEAKVSAANVLCLPIFPALTPADQNKILYTIKNINQKENA
jgi:dTDP-4-amino-4,6-dideoxygalactose transaminase